MQKKKKESGIKRNNVICKIFTNYVEKKDIYIYTQDVINKIIKHYPYQK